MIRVIPGQVTIFDHFCGFSLLLTLTVRKTHPGYMRTHVTVKEKLWMDRQLNQMELMKMKLSESPKQRFFQRLRRSPKHAKVSFRTGVYKTPASIAEIEKAAE